MSKLRVLHVITRLDPGGSTTNTLETVGRLDKSRYEVELAAGPSANSQKALEFIAANGITCHWVKDLARNVHPWKDLSAYFELRKIIRRGRYDIVHTHTSKAGILGRWAAHAARVKHIVHTPHGHIFYGYFSPVMTAVFKSLERSAAGITTRLIALTSRGVSEHLSFQIGSREQWEVIHSGIDFDAFMTVIPGKVESRRAIGAGEKDFLFVSVTRLEKIKGNHVLINAMAEVVKTVPDAKLVLVGEGTERVSLSKQAARLGIQDRIVFAGFEANVLNYLVACDVFVLASLNEGMGRAVLEAMACERPVIVTSAGGLPELVEDNIQGLVVPPSNAEALARAMVRLAQEPETRRRMSHSALGRATKTFSVQSMVEKIDLLYQRLTG